MIKELFTFLTGKNTYNNKHYYKKEFNNAIDIDRFFDSDASKSAMHKSYNENVIVHKCVNLIAHSVSHIPWIVSSFSSTENRFIRLKTHPILQLLNKPNFEVSGADFFSDLVSSLMLFGNAYVLACGNKDAPPKELYLLNSRNVEIIIQNGRKIAYRYKVGSYEKLYSINNSVFKSQVLHIKTYNPNNELYGLSCLNAAELSIDTHNQTLLWNNSLLKNGARPSGALVLKDGMYLTEEQFCRLKEEFSSRYSGASNSGKPVLLEGGLEWKEISINPKDMDFLESKNAAAREIALAFGIPPQLLGINGDNTYSNMQEARLALWEETLIPLLDKISDAFTNWLRFYFKDEILISFDRDAISALTEKRREVWNQINTSNFMTINEKRAFIGLEPLDLGDKF